MDTKEQEEGRLRSAVSSTGNSSSRDDAQDEEEEKLPISQSDADRSVGSGGSCGPSESSSAPSTAEDIVSRGIASVLGPVVRNFDSSVDGVMSSQKALSRSIDRLTQELDKQLEDAPLPLVVQHAAKLSGLRKRVQFLTHTLHVVKARIANMDRLISERVDANTSGSTTSAVGSTSVGSQDQQPTSTGFSQDRGTISALFGLNGGSFTSSSISSHP
ncbi:hypothetical protein BDL97_05G054400 [Sphagnum fallax]|nr:hypothetical protein BDL97_05G054400 [Sphagnum fallax]KAH8961515.1 hypothetical protein BDL97_05G054400 [Sphagnum fallax]